MITQFKIFENIKERPKEDDYVIFDNGELTIAKIYDIDKKIYFVKWAQYGTSILLDDIIEWSDNKEELELILQALKYNL